MGLSELVPCKQLSGPTALNGIDESSYKVLKHFGNQNNERKEAKGISLYFTNSSWTESFNVTKNMTLV